MSIYKQYGIYGIKNLVNGRMYVGQTGYNFGDRRDCHYACLRGGYGVNSELQNDWNKYGEDQFEFIVLYECTHGEGKEDLNRLEMQYIKQYKDLGVAYNVGVGGDVPAMLGLHLSAETKAKIGAKNRENMTGRKASDETKKKMSETHKARMAAMSEEDKAAMGERISNAKKGKKVSEETRRKIIERERTHSNAAKYSVEVVHEIRRLHEVEGMSIKDIADRLNMNRGTVRGIAKYERWKYV